MRPVTPSSRRWEKKSSASQKVQRPGGLDRLDPGAGKQAPGDLGQVEHAAVGDPLAEVGEGLQHLRPDLVATGPDPGPIAAEVASTAAAPRATIPAASPRQPQWSIATPPGPASATGRQSAVRTSGASPAAGRRARRPPPAPSPVRRTGSVPAARAWTARSALWTCSPIGTLPRLDPDRRREPRPVLDHGGVRVIGEHADVQRVVGRLTDPPTREPNPTRPAPSPAGPSAAASHRTPSVSSHSIHREPSTSMLTGRKLDYISGFRPINRSCPRAMAELVGAGGGVAVELGGQGRFQGLADGGAGEARGRQVGAGDLERDLAPVAASRRATSRRRRGRGRARSGRGRAPGARPRTGATGRAVARASSPPPVRAPRRGSPRRGRPLRTTAARPSGGSTSRVRAKDSPPGRGSTSPQPASSSSARRRVCFLGQLAQLGPRRSGVTVPRSVARSSSRVPGSSPKPKRAA